MLESGSKVQFDCKMGDGLMQERRLTKDLDAEQPLEDLRQRQAESLSLNDLQ